MLLARYTGARAGAILGLTWARVTDRFIDYNDPTRARSRKKRAVVPIHPDLADALAEARRTATTAFVIEYGGEQVASVKKAFGRAAARAGLDHVGPHTLRHSAATWMAIDGVPLVRIAAFLGNSVKMVESVYAKYSPDYLADAVSSLGRGQVVHLNQNSAHKQATRSEKLDLTARKVS
jgi:integrase